MYTMFLQGCFVFGFGAVFFQFPVLATLVEISKEVDCTRIAVHAQFKNLERSLGAVYYNFPHAGQADLERFQTCPRHGSPKATRFPYRKPKAMRVHMFEYLSYFILSKLILSDLIQCNPV
jgi:hypothetical protein